MLKGWFCYCCFAAISQYPSLTLYISFFFYLRLSHPIFLLPYPFFCFFLPFCAGHTVSQGEIGQRKFLLPESPPLPKRCLLMTGSYEAEQGTHFKDVGTPCLDWLVLLKHTHWHRQAHGFICPLNLWLRHIEIKMTMYKSRAGGWESFLTDLTEYKAPLSGVMRLTVVWGNTKGVAWHIEPLFTIQKLQITLSTVVLSE